jgi:hypothetical protein
VGHAHRAGADRSVPGVRYLRYGLSYRGVEELLADRDVEDMLGDAYQLIARSGGGGRVLGGDFGRSRAVLQRWVKNRRVASEAGQDRRHGQHQRALGRAVQGHWEVDLIIEKSGKSQIATLVERHSRFVMLRRIPYDRCADRVATIPSRRIGELPQQLRRSLTWDQGMETVGHAKFTDCKALIEATDALTT